MTGWMHSAETVQEVLDHMLELGLALEISVWIPSKRFDSASAIGVWSYPSATILHIAGRLERILDCRCLPIRETDREKAGEILWLAGYAQNVTSPTDNDLKEICAGHPWFPEVFSFSSFSAKPLEIRAKHLKNPRKTLIVSSGAQDEAFLELRNGNLHLQAFRATPERERLSLLYPSSKRIAPETVHSWLLNLLPKNMKNASPEEVFIFLERNGQHLASHLSFRSPQEKSMKMDSLFKPSHKSDFKPGLYFANQEHGHAAEISGECWFLDRGKESSSYFFPLEKYGPEKTVARAISLACARAFEIKTVEFGWHDGLCPGLYSSRFDICGGRQMWRENLNALQISKILQRLSPKENDEVNKRLALGKIIGFEPEFVVMKPDCESVILSDYEHEFTDPVLCMEDRIILAPFHGAGVKALPRKEDIRQAFYKEPSFANKKTWRAVFSWLEAILPFKKELKSWKKLVLDGIAK